MNETRIKIHNEAGWQRVVFEGPINENTKAVLEPLLTSLGPRCILDLAGVTTLNSSGIRDWSYFIRDTKDGRELVLENCNDEVIRAMNMILNFAFDLPVRSLLRGFMCPSCEHEQSVKLKVDVDYVFGKMPPAKHYNCEKCAQRTEPFEVDSEYFRFLVPT